MSTWNSSKDHRKLQRLQIDLPVSVVRAMRAQSKKLTGLKRPEEGSAAHFARAMSLMGLRKFGVDMEQISDGIIKIPAVKSTT